MDGPAKARKSEEPPKVIDQPSVENRKRSREGDEGDEERLTRGDGDDNMDIGGVEYRGTRERSEKDHEEWTKRLWLMGHEDIFARGGSDKLWHM